MNPNPTPEPIAAPHTPVMAHLKSDCPFCRATGKTHTETFAEWLATMEEGSLLAGHTYEEALLIRKGWFAARGTTAQRAAEPQPCDVCCGIGHEMLPTPIGRFYHN